MLTMTVWRTALLVGAVSCVVACFPQELSYRGEAGDEAAQDAMSPIDDQEPEEATPGDAGPATYVQQVLLDRPVGYWRLGEAPGSKVAVDSSDSGASGQYEGGIVLGVPGAIANDTDTAAQFDGGMNYVDVGQRFGFTGMQSCSFEAWVMPTVDTAWHGILARSDLPGGGGPPSDGFALYVSVTGDPDNPPAFMYRRFQGATPPSVSSTLTEGQQATWSHVVVTYQAPQLLLYVNGIQQDALTTTVSINGAMSDFVIGAQTGGQSSWFSGRLDEVAVYDTALPKTRVVAHYRVGMGMSSSP
jgi:hypothetical protein